MGERSLSFVKSSVHLGQDNFAQGVICLALVLQEFGYGVAHLDAQSFLKFSLTR